MRAMLFATLVGLVAAGFAQTVPAVAQEKKDTPRIAAKGSPASALTRTKLLKVKVTVDSTDERLGEILKEFAAQADMRADQPVMWIYGAGFPHAKKMTFAVKDKSLDEALDLLLTKAGGGLGYVVVSKDGDKYDGWVRLTTTGERGTEPPDATAEDEAVATERLALAKKLIDAGKPAAAKPVLEIVAKKYPTTKAGTEAAALLAKMEK